MLILNGGRRKCGIIRLTFFFSFVNFVCLNNSF